MTEVMIELALAAMDFAEALEELAEQADSLFAELDP